MGAISEVSGFAIKASPHVETPWQRAEGVLGHMTEQKPRQESRVAGPQGAATVAT